jgi:hypothetical protein
MPDTDYLEREKRAHEASKCVEREYDRRCANARISVRNVEGALQTFLEMESRRASQ